MKSRRSLLRVAVATATLEAAQATQIGRAASVAEECSTGHGEDWIWLGNRFLRVGLLQSAGGAIGWLGTPASGQNLINHFDRGRLVQQSWYGREDGSEWNGRPWRWNPVQGGDWKGKPAKIVARRVSESTAFVKTQPIHWAAGNLVVDAVMDQTLQLNQDTLEIRFRFQYLGVESHPPRHQELPAVFANPRLRNLVLAEGTPAWSGAKLRRTQPGWPNEYRNLVEPWAAWVDDAGWGLGCCVPHTTLLTCYRFGSSETAPDACSYFAPIETLAVVPGFEFSWDVWLTIGTVDEIRSRFRNRLAR